MTDPWVEVIAQYMAQTYNGGLWENYTEDQKNVHRRRAQAVVELVTELSSTTN